MTVLITWQGSVLCRHRTNSSLVQRGIASGFEDADPIDPGVPFEALEVSFTAHLRADANIDITLPTGPLRGWRVTRARDGRTLNLSHDGLFLSAVYQSDAVEPVAEAGRWEGFLPLSQADFAALRQVLATDWLVRSSGGLVPAGEVAVAPIHSLNFGVHPFDLRFQVPFDLSEWPNRLTLLRDGWRIEQLCRFRPLVYFSAFGDAAILRQFALSVRSLVEFGRYTGDFAVLTDRSPAEIMALLEPATRPRCSVLTTQAADRMGFMAARYGIGDWAEAWSCQPILYADTDIVFDTDIAPMLHAIARSDRIAAPVEPFSPLRSWAPVGSGLLQLDGCDPRALHGFNSGTIGIPNLASHNTTLRLIARVIANHATLKGRGALPHGDQEIANYVAYRTGSFDTTLISPFVRVGSDAPVSPEGRRGLVHFWNAHGADRRGDLMAAYIAALTRN
jgi:hypothetical protein